MSAAARPYDVVVPTAGRKSLDVLLAALAAADGPLPERVIVVDDRPRADGPLLGDRVPEAIADRTMVIRGAARGPAAARNRGWRAGRAPWVAFLDDDVVPRADWRAALVVDLAACGPGVAATQGTVRVPAAAGRRPTDWERNVGGLERARWATADMAYRRTALQAVGGFDERFPRAYREDADLGLRVIAAGWRIVRGSRTILHPVPGTDWRASLRKQAGNADDVLMRALHGDRWRARAGVPRGRRPRHLAIALAGLASAVLAGAGRRRPAAACGAAWLGGTAELAWARIAPGPRTAREVAAMVVTSALMPFAAAGWWLRGWVELPAKLRRGGPGAVRRPAAVLFDRDGTLVVDVPYNGDPTRVQPVPAALAALRKLRAAGIPTGVVSNQSGVARGLLTEEQVKAVNARIEELLGPLGPWAWCPHAPEDGCGCRKPAPGLVHRAAAALGVEPSRVAVVGDIGADVEAARAAGARAILVPTSRTLDAEVRAAPEVAADLEAAVDVLLGEVRDAR
jgi:histidinol-phosphate phosphatase family protein